MLRVLGESRRSMRRVLGERLSRRSILLRVFGEGRRRRSMLRVLGKDCLGGVFCGEFWGKVKGEGLC